MQDCLCSGLGKELRTMGDMRDAYAKSAWFKLRFRCIRLAPGALGTLALDRRSRAARFTRTNGPSSTGRATVSKTVGRGSSPRGHATRRYAIPYLKHPNAIAACEAKVHYPTRKAAEEGAQRMRSAKGIELLWVYKCRGKKGTRKHWHVTTKEQSGGGEVYAV